MKDNEATNPIQWYLEGFRHYVDFRGRTGRRGYWYFFLFNFLVTLVLGQFPVPWSAPTCWRPSCPDWLCSYDACTTPTAAPGGS